MSIQKGSAVAIDVCNSKAPLVIKFGYLCASKVNIPQWFGMLCFLSSQIQMVAIYIKAGFCHLQNDSKFFAVFYQTWYQWATVGDLFDLNQDLPQVLNIFIAIGIYIGVILLFIIVILIRLIYYGNISKTSRTVWGIICYLHPLVLFFPIHTLILETIYYYYKDPQQKYISQGILILLFTVLILNWFFAAIQTAFFQTIIKTSDPLCAKSSLLRRNEIYHKTVATILMLFNYKGTAYVNAVQNLSLYNYRSRNLFNNLSYYNIKVLYLGACFQVILLPLGFITLIAMILNDLCNYQLGNNFIFVTWSIMIPFSLKYGYSKMATQLARCLAGNATTLNPHLIIQKTTTLTDLAENQEFVNCKEYFHSIKALLMAGKNLQSLQLYGNDMSNRENIFKNMQKSLSNAIKVHPTSNSLKLNLAQLQVRDTKQYLKTNALLEEVRNSKPSMSAEISRQMLFVELELELLKKYREGIENFSHENVNVIKYVEMKEFDLNLRSYIETQTSLQISFWNEYLSHEPDFYKMFLSASHSACQREQIKRDWQQIVNKLDPFFTNPFLTYGLYLSIVNNQNCASQKLLESYIKKEKKILELKENDNNLDDRNMFSSKSFHIQMGGSKHNLGKIIDCSSNVVNVLGYEKKELIGELVTMLMSDFYKARHDKFLQRHWETGTDRLINTMTRMPVIDNMNHNRTCHFHLKINPKLEDGMSYICLLKAVNVSSPVILVLEDGTVDSVGQKVEGILGLKNKPDKKYNIIDLCSGFEILSELSKYRIHGLKNKSTLPNLDLKQRTRYSPPCSTAEHVIQLLAQGNWKHFDPDFLNNKEEVQRYQKLTETAGQEMIFFKQNPEQPTKIVQNEQLLFHVNLYGRVYTDEILYFFVFRDNKFIQDVDSDIASSENILTVDEVYQEQDDHFNQTSEIDGEMTERSNNSQEQHTMTPYTMSITPNPTFDEEPSSQKKNSLFPRKEEKGISLLRKIVNKTKVELLFRPKTKKKTKAIQKEHNVADMKEILMKRTIIHNYQTNESSNSSNYHARENKLESDITEVLNIAVQKRWMIHFQISFALMIIVCIAFNILRPIYFQNRMQLIRDENDIAANSYLVIDFVLTDNQLCQTWQGIITGMYNCNYENTVFTGSWTGDMQLMQSVIPGVSPDLDSINNELIGYITSTNQELIDYFFQPEVPLIDTDLNNTEILSITAAVDEFISRNLKLSEFSWPSNFTSGLQDYDLGFLITNEVNNFLVQNLNILENLESFVYQDISSSRTLMDILSYILYALIALFMFGKISFYFKLQNDAEQFKYSFFRFEMIPLESTKKLLEDFRKALIDFAQGDRLVAAIQQNKSLAHQQTVLQEDFTTQNTSRKAINTSERRNIQMSQMNRYYQKLFLRVLPFSFTYLGYLVYTNVNTNSTFSDLQIQQKQTFSALKRGVLDRLLVIDILQLIQTNSSSTVRNQNVEEDLIQNLYTYSSLQQFIDTFKNSNGEFSTSQSEALFNISCQNFANQEGTQYFLNAEQLFQECQALTPGSNSTSLVSISSAQYNLIYSAYTHFLANRTLSNLENLFTKTLVQTYLLQAMTLQIDDILFNATYSVFNQVANSQISNVLANCLAAFGIIVAVSLINWFFMMKQVVQNDSAIKNMLKVVPMHYIVKNRFTKSYLIENSKGKLEHLKNI